jgi:signal transduction histidine kinase
MRLGEFITREKESILAAWEAFAATCTPAAERLASLELRDHAPQILEAIVKDLATPQSRAEQATKSMGLAPTLFPARQTAAEAHAVLRARDGFDFEQLAAEYRALRASVLRLWMDTVEPADLSVEDMVRFNEAIDQALAESIKHFGEQVEQSRNLMLGMLSHDMRSPLQTIQLTAFYLGKLQAGDAVSDAARKLINSGARMQALLDDLVDFNRLNLGLGIPIAPSEVDLAALCTEEIDLIRAGRPGCHIDLAFDGNCHGRWDGKRVQQLLGNLVINAISHGQQEAPVRIAVSGRESDVLIEVSNIGPVLSATEIKQIFEPLKRGSIPGNNAGLGLGLFIVTKIAEAHGGVAEARSDATETVFSVRLPRHVQTPPHAGAFKRPSAETNA